LTSTPEVFIFSFAKSFGPDTLPLSLPYSEHRLTPPSRQIVISSAAVNYHAHHTATQPPPSIRVKVYFLVAVRPLKKYRLNASLGEHNTHLKLLPNVRTTMK